MAKKPNILIIDNYDSFTYNLVQIVEDLKIGKVTVKRNDAMKIGEVEKYDYLIFSPGPGLPDEAGMLKEIIEVYKGHKKMLGVCLGQQAIGEVFGSKLLNLSKVFHGKKTTMQLTDNSCPIFEGIASTFEAGRYHSWVIDKKTISDDLWVTAIDEEGEIMAIRHKTFKIFGLQFHPESIMTADGKRMISNFLTVS